MRLPVTTLSPSVTPGGSAEATLAVRAMMSAAVPTKRRFGVAIFMMTPYWGAMAGISPVHANRHANASKRLNGSSRRIVR